MLIKTVQSRKANVICVRLHTRKLTRRQRTVGLPDNDKGASPADLREQIAYMQLVRKQCDARESLCQSQHAQSIGLPMPTESTCCKVAPRRTGLPAAGVIDMGL